MSAFLNRADAMAEALRASALFEGIDIIVDRQKELDVTLRKSLSKKKGIAVIIFWSGATNNEPSDELITADSTYQITIWAKPVIQKGQAKADQLTQEVITTLHGWTYREERCQWRAQFISTRLIPHPAYLLYEVSIKIPAILL